MSVPVVTFSGLLDPVDPVEFLNEHYRLRPLYIPGPPAKVRGVSSWEDFGQLMAMTALWSDRTLHLVLDRETIPAAEYCLPARSRDDMPIQQPDYKRLQHWLEQGATVVADLVETLSPGIRAAADALEMGLGAQVSCNAYCSQAERQAFPTHYDSMEVFALQIAGAKTWRVYEGRFEHPVERPGFHYRSFPQSHHEEARGTVALEVEVTPGDLLYIPKGVYHEALAASKASLHLSFGTTEATGLDFLDWVLGSLDEFPAFRAALPAYNEAAAHDAHVARLGERLAGLLSRPDLAVQFREEQKRRAHRLQTPVTMPPEPATPRFRVLGWRASIGKGAAGACLRIDNKEIAVPVPHVPVCRWILSRDQFCLSELVARFGRFDRSALANVLRPLLAGGVLVQL